MQCGIIDTPVIIFEPDQYLNELGNIVYYTSCIASINICNTSNVDIVISCYIIDGSEANNNLNVFYILKDFSLQAGMNTFLKPELFLSENHKVMLHSDSKSFTCDSIISYQVLIQ